MKNLKIFYFDKDRVSNTLSFPISFKTEERHFHSESASDIRANLHFAEDVSPDRPFQKRAVIELITIRLSDNSASFVLPEKWVSAFKEKKIDPKYSFSLVWDEQNDFKLSAYFSHSMPEVLSVSRRLS